MTFFATPSKRAAFFAAIFLLASVPAFAQAPLTITSDQFEQVVTQLFTSGSQTNYDDTGTAGLQALINQTGADQMWNLQTLPFVIENITLTTPSNFVTYPGGAAAADSFPNSTHVNSYSFGGNTFYQFYRIDGTGFYTLGSSEDSMGTPIVTSTYTPPEENVAFPLTYQTSWSSTSVITSRGSSSQTEEVDGHVDGWGTYSVPRNNSIQALRIRQRTQDNSTYYNDTSYSFQWFNLSSFSAEIDADANQNATDASYAVPSGQNIVSNNAPRPQFSISVASNPVGSPTNVSFTLPSERQVRVSLMDALGRQSQVLMNGMARAGMNTLPLDPASLMNGTYFLQIESEGNSAMQKVIVNH